MKNTKDTKKEFNTHFPGVKIIHAKGTRRGSLLIELESSNVAETIVLNWKPHFFSSDGGNSNKTTAALLKDKNCKGILHHIDHDYSDDYIVKEISKCSNLQKQVSARRFVKGTQKLSTVLITFGCKEDLEHCLEHGLTIGRSPETVHPYRASPSVLRCWKCWKFDHTAAWCSKKKKICQYCAQVHEDTECIIHTKNAHDQYKCVNCQSNRNHPSSSNECPAYLEKLDQIQRFAQT